MCKLFGLVLVLHHCCISMEYEHHCVMMDHLTKINVYLNSGSYLAISAASVLDCATECSGRPLCMSFGFESETRSCHLYTTNSSQNPLVAKYKENWNHGDMVDWQKEILGPCGGHRCSLDEQCQLNRGRKVPVCVRGPFVRLVTPRSTKEEFKPIPDQTLRELTGNTSSLRFLVKTCHDANFELTQKNLGHHIFRVVIGGGGNTGTFIYDTNTKGSTTYISTPSVLDCDRFLPFWLDWSDKKISVGTGTTIKRNVLVEKPLFIRLEVIRITLSSFINNNGTWLFFVQVINQ